MPSIEAFLREMIERGASDLHLTTNSPPMIRLHGELVALADKINRERHEHIVTVEDPIEFVHEHKSCLVNQREVFSDTQSFTQSLKHVLRQDPDIVLIGEMRDLETIEAALVVAETGHLV